MGPTVTQVPVKQTPAPPSPPPPPRKDVDPAVRQPDLHQGKTEVPPPERYVVHEVEQGETLTEVSRRYQTTVPLLQAANPQLSGPDQLEIGQKINVPLGADYGREPTPDVVEPGQTLAELAREHPGVNVQDIAGANRHRIPNPDRIRVGQQLWVPAERPATPLEQKVQGTDDAAAELERAQKAYDALPSGTNGGVRTEVYQGVQHATDKLKTAVQGELDERVKGALPSGTKPTEDDYQRAGQQIKERYQSDPLATQRLEGALTSLAGDRFRASPAGQAQTLIQQARGAGDVPKQVAELNQRLKGAPPEVRDAVLNGEGGKKFFQDAAAWATEPLAGGSASQADEKAREEFNAAGQQAPGAVTMERLEQLTQGVDPALAAQLTGEAIPTLEKYVNDYRAEVSGQPLGQAGMANLLKVLDRGADTPAGQANLDKVAQLGLYTRDAIRLHVSGGGSPAYAVALAKHAKVDAATVLQEAYDGAAGYCAQIADTAKAYSAHVDELGWLVQNHGGAMTPEQLQQAIADYTKEKGPDWDAKGKEFQNTLAAQGETLQKQLLALQQLPAGTPGREEALTAALNDPASSLALNTAWEKNPELLKGVQGDRLLAFFADPTVKGSAKLLDTGRKLLTDLTTQFVKRNVLSELETFNPNDPASVQKTRDAVSKLRNSNLAQLLGVSTKEMDQATDALTKSMPSAGDSADDIARKMRTLNTELEAIGDQVEGRLGFDPADSKRGLKAFDKSTVSGQVLRGVGMLLGGVGMMASATAVVNDPSLKSWQADGRRPWHDAKGPGAGRGHGQAGRGFGAGQGGVLAGGPPAGRGHGRVRSVVCRRVRAERRLHQRGALRRRRRRGCDGRAVHRAGRLGGPGFGGHLGCRAGDLGRGERVAQTRARQRRRHLHALSAARRPDRARCPRTDRPERGRLQRGATAQPLRAAQGHEAGRPTATAEAGQLDQRHVGRPTGCTAQQPAPHGGRFRWRSFPPPADRRQRPIGSAGHCQPPMVHALWGPGAEVHRATGSTACGAADPDAGALKAAPRLGRGTMVG
ncbi:LysM peptidoglycan-binding domain-containing protein [Ottowia oryzae]|uniref:LysM domain-containing protein n=1 Tax=Ottowia oryzae TaxID=2109914 RepID=A0A2S0MF48_9BURK|nr:LysM peptidoglycan-binding domain-containing protein [Ottowia oryzae]AVO34470.1 hypothetical protein C6570_09700 [Ottowia oryzae]